MGLIDERAAVSCHLDDCPLGEFPDGFVEGFDVIWDVGDVLDGAAVRDDAVFHVVGPEAQVDQVL